MPKCANFFLGEALVSQSVIVIEVLYKKFIHSLVVIVVNFAIDKLFQELNIVNKCSSSILLNSCLMPKMPQPNRTTFLSAVGCAGANLTAYCQVAENLIFSQFLSKLQTYLNFPGITQVLSLLNPALTLVVFISLVWLAGHMQLCCSSLCSLVA